MTCFFHKNCRYHFILSNHFICRHQQLLYNNTKYTIFNKILLVACWLSQDQ